MARHLVIEIDTAGHEGLDETEALIDRIKGRVADLPVLVIRPSHGGIQMSPRVESVGWTDEDRRRA